MTAIDLASIVTMERRESGFREEVEREETDSCTTFRLFQR